jgi:hypothetical protein
MYKIVSSCDNIVLEQNLSKEEAEKKIIFYDTEQTPCRIESSEEE